MPDESALLETTPEESNLSTGLAWAPIPAYHAVVFNTYTGSFDFTDG
jgi:hypothetical protein